jgi:hypothetical protein
VSKKWAKLSLPNFDALLKNGPCQLVNKINFKSVYILKYFTTPLPSTPLPPPKRAEGSVDRTNVYCFIKKYLNSLEQKI